MIPEQILTELKVKGQQTINSWGCYPALSQSVARTRIDTIPDRIGRNYQSTCMSNISNAKGCKSFWIHNVREYDKDNDPVYWTWTCWISDPEESPWRLILPKEKSLLIAGEDVHSTKFRDNHGFYFPAVNGLPFLLFVNFCKAVRNCRERYDIMKVWYNLVQLGAHPALSYIISPCYFSNSLRDSYPFIHGAVSVSFMGDKDVIAFANGNIKDTKVCFPDVSDYIGNDNVWGISFEDEWQKKIQLKAKERQNNKLNNYRQFASFFDKCSSSSVARQIEKLLLISIEELAEVLKEEEKRLGLTSSHLLERIKNEAA